MAQVVFLKLKTLETCWGQVWNIWPLSVGRGSTPPPCPGGVSGLRLVGCELQRGQEEMGSFSSLSEGSLVGKHGLPGPHSSWGKGAGGIYCQMDSIFYIKIRWSFPKHQWGREEKQNGKQRGRRLFLKFLALQCICGGGRD